MENENIENTKVNIDYAGEVELPKLDVTPYIGKKVKIATADQILGRNGYYLRLATEAVDQIETKEGKKDLCASRQFGLVEHSEDEGKTFKLGWGKESKLADFLKKMKVENPTELIGKEVIVQSETRKGTDWLTFN